MKPKGSIFNDKIQGDLVALGAYLFLLLAVFIRQGCDTMVIVTEIAVGVVAVVLVVHMFYRLSGKGTVRERPTTWRRSLSGALYWVLLAVILGQDSPTVWVFWALAGLFAVGTVVILLARKQKSAN
jgi:hypothetical protein